MTQSDRKPPSTTAPDPASRPAREAPSAAWLVAAAGTGIEGLVIIGMAVASLWSAATGSASTTTRAVTEAVMLLVLAAGVVALAVALVRRKHLAKTPTLLWNGMLVPVAFNLIDGGARGWGIVLLAVAVVAFVAALLLPRFDPDADETSVL